MHDSFANPVDPIAQGKLERVFSVIKQLNEMAPAQRSAAAMKGLRHDANETDVILSAYIMQAYPEARGQVRAAYADQQSVLHINADNRKNYMNPDPELRSFGKAKAEDRFDRMFEQTRPVLDQDAVVKPKKSVTFADQAQNKVNASVDSKSGTRTVEKREFQDATKKTPPILPDRSLKPSQLTAATDRTKTTFGTPGFGVPKQDVPGQKPVQTQGSSKGGPVKDTQPPQALMSAKRVVEESAFAEKTIDSKIQHLQQKLNFPPKKLTNSHQ